MNGVNVYRLIVDEPAPGPWNMAVDEALLQAAVDENTATLRLYQWSEPTLSLGYFQRYEDREGHTASRECAIVRRQSGGGAILHDSELTYSLTLPASHPVTRDATALYTAVHEAFIQLLTPHLRQSRDAARLQLNDADSPLSADEEPFLCFQRRARGDLLLEIGDEAARTAGHLLAYKILGSAQRRHRGAILQHGSLLLEQSPAAPELPGWHDLVGGNQLLAEIVAGLPQQLGAVLTNCWIPARVPNSILDVARRIERTRYSVGSWTRRR